jgi:hypothetical protein
VYELSRKKKSQEDVQAQASQDAEKDQMAETPRVITTRM